MISKRHLLYALLAVTLAKLLFTIFIPAQYAEAYYALQAQHLSTVYVDQPPMIAWLLHLMSYVSDSISWYRTLALLAALAAVWVVYRFAAAITDAAGGRFAALLFVLSPSYVLTFLISTDAPALLAVLLGVWAFYEAIQRNAWRWAVLSGVAFGLGFLSKYLIVVPLLGVIVYALLSERRRRLPVLAITLLAASPFVLQHVYANYMHCWVNLTLYISIFGAHAQGFASLGFYLLGLLIVLTPWGLWYLWRERVSLQQPLSWYLALVALVSGVAMALLSLKTVIGLHFLLLFAPFVFVLYALIDKAQARRRMLQWSAGYAGLWIVLFTTLLVMPWDKLKGWQHSADFVIALHPQKVCAALAPYSNQPIFTSFNTPSSILSYACKRDIGVLFSDSDNGREYDQWQDLRLLAGKSLVMIDIGEIDTEARQDYFTRSRREIIRVEGGAFTVFVGEGFRYERYQEQVLRPLRDVYYRNRFGLPMGGCPFTQRYFGATADHGNKQ